MVGFPRCGSEYTSDVLRQHPEIDIPQMKEINYLNQNFFFLDYPKIKTPKRILPLKWYFSLFKDNKIRMDCSIKSAYDSEAPKRIKKILGDIPLIFLIRKRKDHKRSMHKLMRRSACIDDVSYEEFISNKGNKKILDFYSDFDRFIGNYRRYFSKIHMAEVVDGNNKKEIEKILFFLKVKKMDLNLNMGKNAQDDWVSPTKLYRFKHKILIKFPWIHSLVLWVRYNILKKKVDFEK